MAPLNFSVLLGLLLSFTSIAKTDDGATCPTLFYDPNIYSEQDRLKRHFIVGIAENPAIVDIETNSSGCVTKVSGVAPEMLDWISKKLKFTYSFMHIKDKSLDPASPSELPGVGYYLTNDICDFVMGGDFYAGPKWTKHVQLSDSYLQYPNPYIIPMPAVTFGAYNVFRPFQWQTWLCIGSSLAIITLTLTVFANHFSEEGNSYVFEYVIGVLLNQGGFLGNKRLFIVSLAATVWCLAALVLTAAYNSLMTSFLAMPDVTPLIEYTADLTNRPQPNVHPIVWKDSALEQYISEATDGVYKQLWDMVKSYPKGRCDTVKECIDLVKSGNHVFMAEAGVGWTAMYDDFHATRECSLTFAKWKADFCRGSTWIFKIGAPFFEDINLGMIQLIDSALTYYWLSVYEDWAQLCDIKAAKLMTRGSSSDDSSEKLHRLTLVNLFGAFLVLIVGYLASIICFLAERVHHRRGRTRNNKRTGLARPITV